MYTMGDVARGSIGKPGAYHNEELLYRLFGINAELLIDLAWGYEPCRMEHIKAYQPENNSVGSGQVLHCPYTAADARLVVKEMTRGVKYCQAHSQQNRRQHVHKQQAQNHNHGSSSPISSRTTTKKVVPVDDILKLDIHVNFHSWI